MNDDLKFKAPRLQNHSVPSRCSSSPDPMEFAGERGPAAADDDHRFADHLLHGDSMHVIRDALLSQLQKDRHRQEIIEAGLARIERAMAQRSSAAPHQGTSSSSCTNNDKAACQENAASGERKQESDEAVPHKKTWSCCICQVEASSEGNLMQHFAGQKHLANIKALKAVARAEKARKARLYAGKKPAPTWVCKFCTANCTAKSHLDNHLKGKKHRAKIEALLEECKAMAQDQASTQEQDEVRPADSVLIFCGTCQVKCASPSVKESHVRGQKHQMNVRALQAEAKRLGIVPPKIVKQKQDAPSAGSEGGIQKALYFCRLCKLQCNSKSTLGEHRLGKKHLEKVQERMYSSFCHVCNLQCNSEKMLASHCTGSKHKANLNGC